MIVVGSGWTWTIYSSMSSTFVRMLSSIALQTPSQTIRLASCKRERDMKRTQTKLYI